MIRSALAAALAAALSTTTLSAQEPGWSGEAEIGANYFFGNTEQSLVTTRLEGSNADSLREIGGDARFTYGKASDSEGRSRLSNRSWALNGSFDLYPFAFVSYFALGGLESSFQREIDLRSTVGGGVKLTFVRDSLRLLDWSLGLVAETTTFDEDVEAIDPDADETIARWSSRFRAKRTVGDDRVVLDHVTLYRPKAGELGDYVVSTASSVAYKLTDTIALKLSFVDVYDSRAEDRGARSNNDGQVFFSLLGTF